MPEDVEPWPRRPQRRRQSLSDLVLVWGFLLSFAALFAVACVEAWKIVSVVPAAFEASPSVGLRNPMDAHDDTRPVQGANTHMTPNSAPSKCPKALPDALRPYAAA